MAGNLTSAILQSQSLKLVTIVIVINVVIGGFSGEDIKNVAMFMKKNPVLENSRFKTLEHLFKTFETTLPNLSLGEREI